MGRFLCSFFKRFGTSEEVLMANGWLTQKPTYTLWWVTDYGTDNLSERYNLQRIFVRGDLPDGARLTVLSLSPEKKRPSGTASMVELIAHMYEKAPEYLKEMLRSLIDKKCESYESIKTWFPYMVKQGLLPQEVMESLANHLTTPTP